MASSGETGKLKPHMLPQKTLAFEELLDVVTRAVAKLSLDWSDQRGLNRERLTAQICL